MPFSQVFERNVNHNMQEDAQGNEQNEEADIKKYLKASEAKGEEEDYELSEKKDRPPRFSTVFGGTPPPQIVERYIEPPKKKKGVYIPLPLFIVLAIILFFESTLLFAYTIIALDNNLPSGLFPIGSTRLNECNCAQQPAINVAPKFFVGAADTSAQPDSLPTTSSSTSTSSTSTTTPTAEGTAHTTAIVTVTPTPVAVSSVINLTVDANGSTLSPSPTSTTSGNANKRASLESALKSIISAKSEGGEKQAPTTLATATSPTKDDATTTTAAGGGGPCFGGAGAVGLVCPGGVGTGGKI